MGKFPRIATFCAFAAYVSFAQAAPNQTAKSAVPRLLNDGQKIEHALNRLAFGARPGDIEQVRQIGLQRWIE